MLILTDFPHSFKVLCGITLYEYTMIILSVPSWTAFQVISSFLNKSLGNSLRVQGLELCALTDKGLGFISDKGSGVANCNVFLCVFLHFREQPNISIYLLTESGPCNIVTGLSKAVCFQLKGI